jgi:prepilin-type processing-associated H-X9-DG protein
MNNKPIRRQDCAILLLSVPLLWNLAIVGPPGRERARRAVCLANLTQLTYAWNLYADDNDGRLVNGDTGEYTRLHDQEPSWVLMDWTGSMTIEQKEQAITGGALFPYTGSLRLYRCPLGGPAATRGYSIVDAMNCTGWPPDGVMLKNKSAIDRPSARFVFVDQGGNVMQVLGGWTCYVEGDRWWDPPPVHHNNGTNFSFADGHCEYWAWNDPRTVQFGQSMLSFSGSQPGNEDIRRTQAAAWGDAPEPSPQERGPQGRNR